MGERSFNKYFKLFQLAWEIWQSLGWKIRINKKKKEKKNAS